MKVTFKTKILAIALSGVALVSVPQSGYAANIGSLTTSASEAFASIPGGDSLLSGGSTVLSAANAAIGKYKEYMSEYSQAACSVSAGLGNSSLYSSAMGKVTGFIDKQKGKVGGFAGGIIDNALDGATDASKSRHECIVDGRKKMMITAMEPYYTYTENNGTTTAENYLSDYLSDAAGDWLNDQFEGTFIGDNVDFNNVTDKAADCLGGEMSVECGGAP